MSTHDNRLDALERRVTSLEVRRLHDETLAKDSMPPEQGRNLRELNENMTILLGVMGKQGQDIKAIKSDVSELKASAEQRFTSLEEKLNQALQLLTQLARPGQDTP